MFAQAERFLYFGESEKKLPHDGKPQKRGAAFGKSFEEYYICFRLRFVSIEKGTEKEGRLCDFSRCPRRSP